MTNAVINMGVQIRYLFLDDLTTLGGYWALGEMAVEGPSFLGTLLCPRTCLFSVSSQQEGREHGASLLVFKSLETVCVPLPPS